MFSNSYIKPLIAAEGFCPWTTGVIRHFRTLSEHVMAAAVREVTLIGVCDGPIDANKHRPTFLTNKIGGRPDWLPDVSRTSPQCRCCGEPVVLVVQVYCPLDSSPYHRNLHLFACPGPDCSGRPGSWTVLRSQGLEEEARTVGGPEPPQEAPPAVTAWCDGADDWGMEEEEWGGGKEEEEEEVEEEPSGGGGSISAKSDVINTPKLQVEKGRKS